MIANRNTRFCTGSLDEPPRYHKRVCGGLALHAAKVLTVTVDNDTEFADHENITRTLGIDFYFAYPDCFWERGLNENTNGLVRQYFPEDRYFIAIEVWVVDTPCSV